MKRLFSAKLLVIPALILMVSCSSTSFTEKAVREAETYPLEERAEFYEKTLKKDKSLPVFYNLIHTYIEMGMYGEAEGWLRVALANHPSAMRLYNAGLYMARETHDAELAKDILEKAVTRWPGDETLTSFWMRALRETKDERAFSEAVRASERFPKNQDVINILADNTEFYETKRKITPYDFSELDLPYETVWNTIEETVIRTWRSQFE